MPSDSQAVSDLFECAPAFGKIKIIFCAVAQIPDILMAVSDQKLHCIIDTAVIVNKKIIPCRKTEVTVKKHEGDICCLEELQAIKRDIHSKDDGPCDLLIGKLLQQSRKGGGRIITCDRLQEIAVIIQYTVQFGVGLFEQTMVTGRRNL